MSSKRPEEIIRKLMQGASYGDHGDTVGNYADHDGTEVLAKAEAAFEFGDWVVVSNIAAGYLTIKKATSDADPGWVGVVQATVASGSWVKVKTAGVCIAKVDGAGSLSAGDTLQLASGQTYAEGGGGLAPCGRFLKQLSGSPTYSWVHIGGAMGIAIHHHDDPQNTVWTDNTSGTPHLGYSWNLFKVETQDNTGGEAAYRLMLAIGGTTTHGESNKEGYGWGGVIGLNTSQGVGQIGGNESAGKQGIIGAESTVDDRTRLNIRSFAGVNARDRYPARLLADCVGPIRYTQKATDPKWRVEAACDTVAGCTAGSLFWGGTMRPDTTPAPSNGTSWGFQWTPQFQVERDCCSLENVTLTGVTWPCETVSNTGNFQLNITDVAGAYEWIIPYGYTACANRKDLLSAMCCAMKHIQRIWYFLGAWSGAVESQFVCIDTKLVALGQTACCGTSDVASVPLVGCGPNGAGDCAATACD